MNPLVFHVFFFSYPSTTEIYTLSYTTLFRSHQLAIRISGRRRSCSRMLSLGPRKAFGCKSARSEEHTSELQSRQYLVCRLLLEKKKTCVFSRRDTVSQPLRSSVLRTLINRVI